jgi:hypothetical protein
MRVFRPSYFTVRETPEIDKSKRIEMYSRRAREGRPLFDEEESAEAVETDEAELEQPSGRIAST